MPSHRGVGAQFGYFIQQSIVQPGVEASNRFAAKASATTSATLDVVQDLPPYGLTAVHTPETTPPKPAQHTYLSGSLRPLPRFAFARPQNAASITHHSVQGLLSTPFKTLANPAGYADKLETEILKLNGMPRLPWQPFTLPITLSALNRRVQKIVAPRKPHGTEYGSVASGREEEMTFSVLLTTERCCNGLIDASRAGGHGRAPSVDSKHGGASCGRSYSCLRWLAL